MEHGRARKHEEVRTNTVIIGAGASGLALGACLRRKEVPFVILEKADQVGAAWRKHYERLHLHTSKGISELPHFSFPPDYPRYPSRLQFVRYLEDYAEHFDLRPRFGQQVTSVSRHGGWWETQIPDGLYRSHNVVVATGHARVPKTPSWPGQDGYPGMVIHSSQYKNGEPFSGQDVLVVGFGNSGGEIAIDLYEHGVTPRIAVRSPVNVIPRDVLGLPLVAVAGLLSKLPARLVDALTLPIQRLMYGDLDQYGLRKLPNGPATQVEQDQRIPLIDVGTIDLIRKGHIEVRPGIERFEGEKVIFADGRREVYDAVILATGYQPRVDAFLQIDEDVLDDNGCPSMSGCEALPGLFFCGFHVSPAGALREINREARKIAKAIQKGVVVSEGR